MLNTELLYDPAIPPPGIYLGYMSVYVHAQVCTQMSTAALFLLVKQSKSNAHQWVKCDKIRQQNII